MYDSEPMKPPDIPLEHERDGELLSQSDIAELAERVYRLITQEVRLERARGVETKHQIER